MRKLVLSVDVLPSDKYNTVILDKMFSNINKNNIQSLYRCHNNPYKLLHTI